MHIYDVCCPVIVLASGGESALQMTSALVDRYHLLTSTLQLLLKGIGGDSINHISGGCFSNHWLFKWDDLIHQRIVTSVPDTACDS